MTSTTQQRSILTDNGLAAIFLITALASITMCSVSDDHYDYKHAQLTCEAVE